MHRRFFQHISAGGAINFMHQWGIRSRQEHVGFVVLHRYVHAPNKSALRQVTQQVPEIDKTQIQSVVEHARF